MSLLSVSLNVSVAHYCAFVSHSVRSVSDKLAYRGIILTQKTVREWAKKFGRAYANKILRHSLRLGDKQHLDEVVVITKAERHFLWRTVNQDGFVLEVLVLKHRNTKAAKRFMRELLSDQGCSPGVMVIDRLGSDGAANREWASPLVIIASIKA